MFGSATPRVLHLKGMHPEYEALLVDFETGSAQLRPEHEAWLQRLANRIAEREAILGAKIWEIHSAGFASQVGDAGANLQLSHRRALSAMNHFEGLRNRPRQMRKRLHAFGEERPRDLKVADNALDRAVHFGIVGHLHVVPPKKKREPRHIRPVVIDLGKEWVEGNRRRRPVEVQVISASEAGVSVGKYGAGIGFSSFTAIFTVRDPRTGEKRTFNFLGDGFGAGLSIPAPIDGMLTYGEGKVFEVQVHESIKDIWKHFTGPAEIDVMGDYAHLTLKFRHDVYRCHFELKMPTQIQLPSYAVKAFDGRVKEGRYVF